MKVTDIKDGDIFFWSFKDEKRHMAPDAYWAKSRYAIAQGGLLYDTFWSSSPTCVHSYHTALDIWELKLLGNLNDLEKKPEYYKDYYDNSDIVNINHSNSPKGNFYIRKGAERDKQKMIEIIKYKIESEESNIRMAKNTIKRLNEVLSEIDAGKALDEIYF